MEDYLVAVDPEEEEKLRSAYLAEAEAVSQAWSVFADDLTDTALLLERGERTGIKDVRFNQKKDSRIDFEVLAEDEDCYDFSVYAEETETGYGLRNIQKWASPLGPEEKRPALDLMEQLTEI